MGRAKLCDFTLHYNMDVLSVDKLPKKQNKVLKKKDVEADKFGESSKANKPLSTKES